MTGPQYYSTKRFSNFSVALRQWKAAHSHCQLLHGYAFEVKVVFGSNEPDIDKQLDDMNWIVDFGGFKAAPQGNGLSDWLKEMFDHTTLIEASDPYLEVFQDLQGMGLLKLHVMEKMGAESMARLIFDKFNKVLSKTDAGRCKVVSVEVFENSNNSAIFGTL